MNYPRTYLIGTDVPTALLLEDREWHQVDNIHGTGPGYNEYDETFSMREFDLHGQTITLRGPIDHILAARY